MSKGNKSKRLELDVKVEVPGAEQLAGAAKEISTDAAQGLFAFIGSICKPVGPQLGALFADQVKYWRYNNFLRFTEKTKKKHEELGVDPSYQVHPRMMIEIAEGVVKQHDDRLLDWWAGLTVAACEECPTDEDIIFNEKMDKITCSQASVLEYACTNAEVQHTSRGLLIAKDLVVTDKLLFEISGTQDVNKLDRELDSLVSHQLLCAGFDLHKNSLDADITPTALGLHFYARCKGIKSGLIEFYSSTEMTHCPKCGRIHQ